MLSTLDIDHMRFCTELQIFDRKSARIDAKALAITIIAFANADGGDIAIGLEDDGTVTGIDSFEKNINELLRAPFDFCVPSVKVKTNFVECIDYNGKQNHILIIQVPPSSQLHSNQADEAFMRVGDKSKKLTFEERTQLMYDKGERFFEDKPVADATLEDIDMLFVQSYIEKIGYSKTATEYLKENKGFVREKDGSLQISTAAILLFGKAPQQYFPRARIRFIRYEGIEELFGAEMNVIKDVIFEGKLLDMITASIDYLKTQIKEKTYLGADGLFVTEQEYPVFVRQEMIVNAVTHRAYSISGTDIQIKMFDNRLVVESPGQLPGLVRKENIRYTHFSRNPKIAEFLKAYQFVKEYGEGVDRMCKELERVGLKAPEYFMNSFLLQAVVYNAENQKRAIGTRSRPFNDQSRPFNDQSRPFDDQSRPFNGQSQPFDEQSWPNSLKKVNVETVAKLIEGNSINKPTMDNIFKVYENIEANQIFSLSNVEEILKCSNTTAKRVMSLLREGGIIVKVKAKGAGRGKYRFANQNDAHLL